MHLTAVEPVADLPRSATVGGNDFRVASEVVIRRLAGTDCVIVGRAAAIVLAGRPDTLHLRFDGPPKGGLGTPLERWV